MTTKTTLPGPPRAAPSPPDDHEYHDGIYYPYEDGEPLAESTAQAVAMYYLFGALAAWFRDSEDVFVVMDLLIYFVRGDVSSSAAPDVAVIRGVEHKEHRYSWRSWLEGDVVPSVVVEFASISTWRDDVGVKRERYARMGVSEYWRSDPTGDFPIPVLVGERLVNGRYEPIPLHTDRDGILRGRSDELNLDFCVLPSGELRLWDPETRVWLRSMDEDAQNDLELAKADARRHSRAREREARARQAAEDRQEELEAENRRLRELLDQM